MDEDSQAEPVNSSLEQNLSPISEPVSLRDFQIPIAAELLSLSPDAIYRLSPAAIAYIGDAVYELYIRTCYLMPPKRLRVYHDLVVAKVRAERQAQDLRSLEPYLTSTELDWVKRGRNAASRSPRRADPETYQQATGLETLIGYLYLTNPQRLADLLSKLQPDSPTANA